LVHKSFLSSVDEKTEELFNFENQPGYVEDLGNGHSVMVMIPELVDLEEDLMERPIQSVLKTWLKLCVMKDMKS
jgi:hypothetical protein